MLLNCGVGENSWESLGLQGDPTSPFWKRSALGFLCEEWCWSWNSSTLATSCEELTHWKRLWCWRDRGQEEKGTTEDDMAGWHHRLDGCESEWTPGVGDGPGGLTCCDSRARKESDMTEQLSWTELNARSSWVLYSVLWIMSFSGSASENRHWDHPCVRAGKCSLYLDPQAWVISHTFAVMSNSQNTPDIPLHFFLTVQLSYFW